MALDTLICQVTDMDRAVEFYRDVLELKTAYVSPGWTSFDLGGVQLGLHPPFGGEFKPSQGGWVVGIRVEDLAGLRGKLLPEGRTRGDFHDVPGGAILEFTDPDGNALQAIQRGVTAAQLSSS